MPSINIYISKDMDARWRELYDEERRELTDKMRSLLRRDFKSYGWAEAQDDGKVEKKRNRPRIGPRGQQSAL